MERIKVSVDELMIVLNMVVGDNFTINAPLYRSDLLRIGFGKLIIIDYYIEDVLASLHSMVETYHVMFKPEEVPSRSSIRDSLMISGSLTYPNMDEVISKIEELGAETSLEKPSMSFLAIDTNVLYNRFLSNIESRLRRMPPILVSKCVVSEISDTMQKRLRQCELSLLRKLFNYYGTEGLSYQVYNTNTPSLVARRAFSALRELERIKNKYRVVNTGMEYCKGDRSIVEDYAKFASQGSNVVFLTFDSMSRAYSYSYNLESIFVETPAYSRPKIEFYNLCEVIYQLLQVFMILKISSGIKSVQLYNMWSGKRIDDWVEGMVMLETSDKEVLKEIITYRKVRDCLSIN
ncbi:MAG: hypothetical protein B6U94_05760 [Thermofilum sp. ex4484_79]|nr:MAG: hypothetical protein B6U94_05760 [Thermofilum sp. ex4484_79]